jgi:DNA-binding CsgD family transcriptional regulator
MHPEIVGRRAELAAIVTALEADDEPSFRALVLEGVPGIGKTTLWRAGVMRAEQSGALVLTARPTAAEARLPYSALGDLVRGVPSDALEGLAAPVGPALRAAALLVGDDEVPDGRLVARGLADVLRELANGGPLVVAVDDVQWLDPESRTALAYALRRLSAARVLLARRPPSGTSTELEDSLPPSDVNQVRVGPLSLSALHEILTERTRTPLPRPVLVKISRVSGGNPYFALELARELIRAGTTDKPSLELPHDATRLTAERILRFTPATQAALLRLALSSRELPGAPDSALQPAIDDGLVEIDGAPRFSHPLVLAAVVEVASPTDRREAHLGLATTANDELEAARHRALAAVETDPEAVDTAVHAYEMAIERRNVTVALELAELALRLTPLEQGAVRLERARAYADCLDGAGATPEARAVLEREIEAAPRGDERSRALARLAYVCWRDEDMESGLAAGRAALEEAGDLDLRGEILENLTWLLQDDHDRALECAAQLVEVRERQGDRVLLARARLLEAYYLIVTSHPPPRDVLENEIAVLSREGVLDFNPVPEMWAKFTDRLDDARAILAVRLARGLEIHDEHMVVACLFQLGEVDTWLGDLAAAATAFDEALALSDELTGATYLGSLHSCVAMHAAVTGSSSDADLHAREALRLGAKGVTRALAHAAAGTVAFAAGKLADADAEFGSATAVLDAIGMREPARFRYHGDHVETLVALGELDRAQALVDRLTERLAVFDRPWIAVQALRGKALVAGASGDLDHAIEASLAARMRAADLPMPFEQARTDLVLGRLLRRAKRRGAAREALETALATFEALPAPRWAERTRDELARLGLVRTDDELTEAEQAVAAAAASGLRNREIAEQLFMSPKTVEAHLSRVYRKLGIRNRAALANRLAEGSPGR